MNLSPWTRRYMGRALLHVMALFSVPAVLRILDFRPARRVVVFYCGVVLVGFAGTLMVIALTRRRWITTPTRILYLGAAPLLLLIAAIHAYNTLHFGTLIAESADAIFQTNLLESLFYVASYMNPWSFALAVIWIGLFVASASLILSMPPPIRIPPAVLILWIALLATGVVATVTRSADALLLFHEGAAYRKTLSEYEGSRSALYEGVSSEVGSDFEGDLIVVIGESLSRHHMRLYGYPRETTPRLSERRDDLIVFNDVISTHSHTIPSLLDAFSFQHRQARREPYEVEDIVNVAERAGFSTRWLSNQNPVGVWDNLIVALARQTGRVVFHSSGGGTVMERDVFDEGMLPSLDAVLQEADPRKLIFVHLMAAHSPYCRNLPAKIRSADGSIFSLPADAALFGEYRPKGTLSRPNKERRYIERINCYDSAVRYVDEVLGGILDRLDQSPRPALLVFFADHGEAPLLGTGHDSRRHSHFHVEIPFVLWANGVFRSAHEERWNSFAANRDVPGSLIDLSFTLADLAQIYGIADMKRRSLVSRDFERFPRATLHERVGYDEWSVSSDPVEKARANMLRLCNKWGERKCAKIWAHRVNSLGAFLEARLVFTGIELDVLFDPKTREFRVHHPPAKDVGLTFEGMLGLDDGKMRYWLDWKNPSVEELSAALERLEFLHQSHDLKDRTIIEMGSVWPEAARVNDGGWRSSYYLPTAAIREALDADDPMRSKKLADELLQTVARGAFGAVSYDARIRPFVDEFLREALQELKLSESTWDSDTSIHLEDITPLERHMQDRFTDVVLVNFDSPFDL